MEIHRLKLPICTIDAQTGTLCRKCKKLYQEGKIDDIDIKLSKLLISMSKSKQQLKDIVFYSSLELEDNVIIVTRRKDISILSSPNILSQIRDVTQKEIRFLERTKDPKKLVEGLLDPVPVKQVSILYIPPFSDKEYKIEIQKKYKDSLPIPEDIIIQTVASVLGTEAYIEHV